MKITLNEAVEWRVPIWGPAIHDALTRARPHLPPGSRVLELGYNSGKMSCFLAQNYGWKITGYEITQEQQKKASLNAQTLGLLEEIDFRYCPPEKTFNISDKFDGIFVKSFLYHNKSFDGYVEWLNWFKSRLNPNGRLIAVENGEGRWTDRLIRNHLIPNCSWKNNQFYNEKIEGRLKEIFPKVEVHYFGGISQYLTSVPIAAKLAQKFEFPKAKNCFIAAINASN